MITSLYHSLKSCARGAPRHGELELLAEGGVPQRVLDGHAAIAQLVGELEHRGHVLAAHRNQKGVESTRRLGGFAVLLQEFSEDDVSHPEPDAREIDARDLLDQRVVS